MLSPFVGAIGLLRNVSGEISPGLPCNHFRKKNRDGLILLMREWLQINMSTRQLWISETR
jgi:hypothetical protein